jgi:hypothetical protein
MHVSESPGPTPAGPVGKEEVCSAGDEAADRVRPRSGRDFRYALERRGGDSGNGEDFASFAALAGWFRSEATPGVSPTTPSTRTSGIATARAVDRVLIGSGPDGAEARIRIGAGALAGTEIQLSTSAVGRAVEAQLLTHAASSRQTLAVVLDEIRSRLRDRGIVLSAKAPASPRTRGLVSGANGPGRSRAGDPTEESR